MGDFVLTLHLAAALRLALPQARIEMAARCPLARFAVGRGPIDAALDPDWIGLHHLYGGGDLPARTADCLRRFDLVINFLGGPQSPVAARLAGCASGPVFSVNPAPRTTSAPTHITRQWMDTLDGNGLALESAAEQLLSVSLEDRRTARQALSATTGLPLGRTVICHPGSGGRAKCCPLGILEEAIRHLQRRDHSVLWMIGPTELEWHGPKLPGRLSATAPVLFEEVLPAAAALLTGADAFIGHDAGMTHLAAALGLPTVALFGPTDPRVWRPLGPHVKVLRFNSSNVGRHLAEDVAAAI